MGLSWFILDLRPVLHPAPEGAGMKNTSQIKKNWRYFEQRGAMLSRVIDWPGEVARA